MSNTVDGEGTVVNLEHNPIAMPYSTNRGTIEVLTGKDKVVDDIGRQGQVRALVIEGNKTLAKLAMDANNEMPNIKPRPHLILKLSLERRNAEQRKSLKMMTMNFGMIMLNEETKY